MARSEPGTRRESAAAPGSSSSPMQLDRRIHEPGRLGILSALAGAGEELTFSELGRLLSLSDGNLLMHLRTLEEAGWVASRRTRRDSGRRRTLYSMTAEGRLAFDFPIVPKIPPDLSAARKEWLRELLTDGQDRWRLVRIGLAGDSEVHAEVDLTGAPHEALEELVRVGVDALRLVVSSLVEPADFLVNGADDCRAVEIRPNRA